MIDYLPIHWLFMAKKMNLLTFQTHGCHLGWHKGLYFILCFRKGCTKTRLDTQAQLLAAVQLDASAFALVSKLYILAKRKLWSQTASSSGEFAFLFLFGIGLSEVLFMSVCVVGP